MLVQEITLILLGLLLIITTNFCVRLMTAVGSTVTVIVNDSVMTAIYQVRVVAAVMGRVVVKVAPKKW